MGSCIDPDIWPQRHKQYRGEVSKTYSNVTLKVAVNCAQGPMYGRYSYNATCADRRGGEATNRPAGACRYCDIHVFGLRFS